MVSCFVLESFKKKSKVKQKMKEITDWLETHTISNPTTWPSWKSGPVECPFDKNYCLDRFYRIEKVLFHD